MLQSFRGKVAVITGAASGIGLALAERLAREGMRLMLADLDGGKLSTVAAQLQSEGADVRYLVTDVADEAAVRLLAQVAYDTFTAVHLLCNNAGIMGHEGDPIWSVSNAEWDRVFDVNLFGVVNIIRHFVPAMLESAGGCHILTTASIGSLDRAAILPCYSASKHAVLAVCETLELQLRARGALLTSSVLLPGYTRTAMFERERGPAENGSDHAFDEVVARASTRQVPMDPSEVADRAIDGVKAGAFWIMPHASSSERLEKRWNEILTAARA